MIIVTGAAGFIGSNIANELYRYGAEMIAIDDLSFGYRANLNPAIELIEDDFVNLPDRYGKDDILVHCATSNIIYSMEHPIATFRNNSLKTIRLFKSFPGKIIYLSTSSVYGNAECFPISEEAEIKTTNAYDSSKYIPEMYLQLRGNYTTLRLTNTYGPNQRPENPYCGVIGRLLWCALKDETFYINGGGTDTRDYVFVSDVVDAVLRAIYSPSKDTAINIGTGEETCLLELVNHVEEITGRHIHISNKPGRDIDKISRRCMDISKASNLLGYYPVTSLPDGLIHTIKWMQYEPATINWIIY